MTFAEEITILKAKLPNLPLRPRKNLFDILRIQHREIRNSNLLAYFFDPNEAHNFGSLFYDALLKVLSSKVELHLTTYPESILENLEHFDEVKTVVTEQMTNGAHLESNKSIDIVLEGDNWVIAIENKIHHLAVNPFDAYWEHLCSKKKISYGVLLTLFPTKLDNKKDIHASKFVNITHQELMVCVQQDLQFTGNTNTTDLLYLREYFKTMESHYYHLKEKPEMETLIKDLSRNYGAISEILNKKQEAENTIEQYKDEIFSQHNYEKAGKWFRRKDKRYDLYFYIIPAWDILKNDRLWLCFEIRNKSNKTIDQQEFTEYFSKAFRDLPNFRQDSLERKTHHTHAFVYEDIGFTNREGTFKSKLTKVLEQLMVGENSTVNQVENYLEQRKLIRTL